MEEKKSIKVSLKTYLISMFIMLLIIGFLLGYILHTGENINKEITEKNEFEKLSNENVISNEIDNVTNNLINDENSEGNLVSNE